MESLNLKSEDGYRLPERSVRVSKPWINVVSDDNGDLSSPVVSVTSPAKTTSSPVHEQIVNAVFVSSPAETTAETTSLPVDEQIVNASTETTSLLSSPVEEEVMKVLTETVSVSDESGGGCEGEGLGGGGSDAVKKPVWSKPVNVVEAVSSVMDVTSWPTLGEATKAACSSSSSESLQALSDGSLLQALEVTVNSSSSSHKPASVTPASTPNLVANFGQSAMRRGSGIMGTQQSPASQESKVELARDTSVKPATVLEFDPKGNSYKGLPRGGFGSQPNSGNDHRYQRTAYKRGYGGPHPQGDGSFHPNYGSKLDHGRGRGQGQGRGYQEWNQHRNFNNRNTNTQPQRGGYIQPSANNFTPFMHPPMPLPVWPFGSNAMYPGPPPPFPGPFYFNVPDPLHDKIIKQIDFYFSNDNLVKDIYLRRHMDEQGWVPVNLIAGFNKVSSLTNNVQLILDLMQNSAVVEVQGDKMRRRDDWMRWLMPPGVQDSLGSQLKGIRFNEGLQLQPGGGDRAPVA